MWMDFNEGKKTDRDGQEVFKACVCVCLQII